MAKKHDTSNLAMAERIEMRLVTELLPYAQNSRTHSKKQVAQIAGSILEFGFTNPILIDGKKGVIAGHGRILAAKRLGLETVPVIELTHLTEAQKRAYIIADNKLSELGGWDEAVLAQELLDLQSLGFDTELTGFSEKELAALADDFALGYEPEGLEGADGGADKELTVSQPGMVWDLGFHLLEVGDNDPLYADQLVLHWQKLTSREARLRDDGRTFDEVKTGVGRNGLR